MVIVAPLSYAQQSRSEFGWEERWQHYVHRTYSPQRMGLLAADVGLDSILSSGGKSGMGFYPDRYGSALSRRITRTSIEFALGGLLKEDARRRPSHQKGLRNRLTWVMTHALLAVGPDGRLTPAYARYAAAVGGVGVGSVWQQTPFTARCVLNGLAGSAMFSLQDQMLTEFGPDFQRIGFGIARSWRRTIGFRRHNTVDNRP
ncbi:MAG: hypothetical protein H7Y20_13760 [Bryobacteraceae bacterium]|nr:hypothetical protein [Bryobacteraceae bacterium]